jgi:hypothetical protein
VGGGAPLTPEQMAQVQPRLVRSAQEVTSGLNELQKASATRADEIRSEGIRGLSTIRDVQSILETLGTPEGQTQVRTGGTIFDRAIRGIASTFGVSVDNRTTPELLNLLQVQLGNLNATARADLLRGLQPISNAEFLSATEALPTIQTNPDALRTLLTLQMNAANRDVERARAFGETNVDELVRQGTVRDWEFRWNLSTGGTGPRVVRTPDQSQPPRMAPATRPAPLDGVTAPASPAPASPAQAAPLWRRVVPQGNASEPIRDPLGRPVLPRTD